MKNDRRLEALAGKIRGAEKQSVANIILIGGWVKKAQELCEHGEYQNWLRENFGWSYRTALRYREAHSFAEKCHRGTFRKLNLTVTALHILASLPDEIGGAIIKRAAASGERLTAQTTRDLIQDLQRPQPDLSEDEGDARDTDSGTDENAGDSAEKQDATDGADDTDMDAERGDSDERDGETDEEHEEEIKNGRFARAFRGGVSGLQETLLGAPGEKAWAQAIDLVGPETLRQLVSQLQLALHRHETGQSISRADEALKTRADRAAATSEERRKKA